MQAELNVQRTLTVAEAAGSYDGIAEHDPKLAELLRAVDASALAPLGALRTYLKSRIES